MRVKVFVIFSLLFVFFLNGQELELTKSPIIPKIDDEYSDITIRFDTTRILPPPTPSGIFRDIAVGTNFKGLADDTVRIFAVMATAPFYAMLFNDTTTNPPLKVATAGWQRHGANGRYIDSVAKGLWGAAVGDINDDGITDMVYGQADTFLGRSRLYRAWWNGTSWSKESIAVFPGAIRDIAIGDADNNGNMDIVVAARNAVYRVRRSGASWARDSLWASNYICYGVAIGDFNSLYAGNEIAVVTQEARLQQIRWTGSTWTNNQIFATSQYSLAFDDVAIGDIDPAWPGNEIIVYNSGNFLTYGNLFIFNYYSGTANLRQLGAYFYQDGFGKAGELCVGNVYELADYNQVVMTAGDATNNNYPIIVWKSDTTFWMRAMPRSTSPMYGVGIGDINKHRGGSTQEMVIALNNRLYEYEQRRLFNVDVAVRGLNFTPTIVAQGDSASVKVRIINYGYNTQNAIPISYQTDGVLVHETCFVSLQLGDSTEYTFRKKYFCASAGFINFRAYASVAGEQYPWDDTTTNTLQVRTVLSGVKTVGGGGDFVNLTNAINNWNNSVIKGNVTFQLLDDVFSSETYPLVINKPVEYRDSTWSLVIKPVSGRFSQFSGNHTVTLVDLNGITKVTIDSVAFMNSSSGAVLRFSNGACNNQVKNAVFKGSCPSVNSGVLVFGGSDASSGNNDNLVENCIVTKHTTYTPANGVFFDGTENRANTNNVIKKCQIYNFSNSGVYLKDNSLNTMITECDIYSQQGQVSSYLYGIVIEDLTVAGTKILANKIHDLITAQSNATICGIYMYYGSTTNPTVIANNFIYLDASVQNNQATIYGIFENTYIDVMIDIYYNSIYIGGNNLTANCNSYGLYKNYACRMNFKNNIVFNNRTQSANGGKHYAIYAANTAGIFNSDYNDLYVANPGGSSGQLIGYFNTPCTTLTQWQTHSGRDANSISKNPNFISVNNLHINPWSPNVDRKGTPISTVITDIDGEERHLTNPDIGADEYDIVPPSAFELVSPVNNAILVPIHGYLIWRASVAAEYYDVMLDTVNPPIQKVSALQTDTFYYYTNLYSNKNYYWQIKAFNDTNPTEAMTVSAIWKFTTVPLPNAPSNLVISNVTEQSMSLSWTDNSNDELGFYIRWDTIVNGNYNNIDSVATNVTNYTAHNLVPNQHYYWRVSAYNQYGYRGYCAKDSATLAEIPGVSQLDSVGFQTMKFILNPNNNSPLTNFCVRVSYQAKTDKYLHPNGVLVDTVVWATFYTFGGQNGLIVNNLMPNTAYNFQTRARNQYGIVTNYGPGVVKTTMAPLSIYYTESFENEGFPPFGWQQQVIVSGGTNWSKVSAGTYPNQTPYHGNYQAKYNSYNVSSNAHSRLIMPPVDLINSVRASLKFYMYHDNQSTNPDSLVIESSIDNGNSWRRISKFNRYSPSSGWQQHLVSLQADSGYISLIAFHAYSGNGRNIYIDSIAIVPNQDVMISEIIRPNLNEEKRVGFNPQVRVVNNSTQTLTIPLQAEIYKPASGFYQGFEQSVFPPLSWTVYNNDGGNFYWQRSTSNPYQGLACAASPSEGGSHRNDDWLVSSKINVQSGDQLRFYYKTTAVGNDSLEVWLSNTTNALSSFITRLDAFGVRNTNYQERVINLSSYSGQQIYLAFVNKSLGGNTILLDEIKVNYQADSLVYLDRDTVFALSGNNSVLVSLLSWTPMVEGQYKFIAYLPNLNNYQEQVFSVNPIMLNLLSPYPNQFINDTTPTFDWQDISGANQYQLQVSNDSNFTSPFLDETVNLSSYTVSNNNALAQGSYFWRVRVTLPAPPDPYSEIRKFIIDTEAPAAPSPISPVCSLLTNNRQPTFIWHQVSGVDLYNLKIFSGESTVVSVNITDTIHTLTQLLNEGTYRWQVSAKDSAGNWSVGSEIRVLLIDLTPPARPILIAPANNAIIAGRPQVLIWSSVADAVLYNLIAGQSEESFYLTDTTYALNFDRGTYQWLVRAKDSAGNWSEFTEPRTFIVQTGWIRKADIPSVSSTKFVKDGGALVGVGNTVYAFRGNKSNEFYKYIVADDIWQNAETIRFTYKPNDPLKLNTKRAGKGAALCFDGEQTIYATKGNSTFELWRFNINSNQWIFDTFVPTNKALKGGTAIVYLNGKVYLLAGNQKKYEPNFFAYTPQTKSWQTLQPAPLIPDGKTYKDGSGLAVLQGKIYALKGSAKCNYFYAYDTISNQWTHLQYESIPQAHPMFGKKTKVKDGGSITSDGERIYAIKGGKRNDFWCYQNGTWIPLETIPKSASYPKTGAALTYTNGRIYLLKGNNTKEFWTYIISEISEIGKPNEKTALTLSTLQSEIDNNRHSGLTINPILIKSSATIRYSVTQAGKVALKVYNTSGELIQSILEQEQQIGVYELPFAVQNLSKGVYFIKFVNENFIAQEKIIIQ